MDIVHERSVNGLGAYSTGAQLREQFEKEFGIVARDGKGS
jgi:hypothetical protein